jgi:hypothetical protein
LKISNIYFNARKHTATAIAKNKRRKKMPVPEGKITTSDIWKPEPQAVEEEADIPFEKKEVEEEE